MRRLHLFLLLALCTLLLSACLGDDGPAATSSAGTPAATPTTVDPASVTPLTEEPTPPDGRVTTSAAMPTPDKHPFPTGTASAESCVATGLTTNRAAASSYDSADFTVGYQLGDFWLSPYTATMENPTPGARNSAWYSGDAPVLVMGPTTAEPIEITAVNVDDPNLTATSRVRLVDAEGPGGQQMTFMGLDIPSAGCWTLTLTAGGETAKVVADVLRFNERPDVVGSRMGSETRVQDQVPDTCPVDAMEIADPRGLVQAGHWIFGDVSSVELPHGGVLYANRENTIYWHDVTADGFTVSGHPIDDPTIQLEARTEPQSDLLGEWVASWITFPEPGCWTITGTGPAGTEEITVFVYQ